VFVEPEATVAGPVSVTVGGVPELWHDVQVEPVLPETPEIPPPEALAEIGQQITASAVRITVTHCVRDLIGGSFARKI